MRQTEVLYISHGVYLVAEPMAEMPDFGDRVTDNLILPSVSAPSGGGAGVVTGTFSGPVELTVETAETEPEPPAGEWERREEATLTASFGDGIVVSGLDGDGDFPRLTVEAGQRYHLRVSVRGFQAGLDRADDDTSGDPVEFHYVQLWPETR